MLFLKTIFKIYLKKANFQYIAVFLLFLISLTETAKAQNNSLSFDHFTVENGLSQSSVLSIAQDSMGFMWFGTKDGLNKYNTQNFEVYKNNPLQKNSISSAINVNTLFTDSKGRLWIGTQEGLNQYIASTNSFISYLHYPKNIKSISNNTIRCVYEDKEGNIWVGTEDGLNKILEDGTFKRYFTSNSSSVRLVHPTVKTIFQDSKNNIWVGTQNGLVKLKQKGSEYQFTTFFHRKDDPGSLAANDVNTIVEDLSHNIWIGTHFNGLDLYQAESNTFKHFTAQPNNRNSLISNVIRKIIVTNDGKLWIATLNGVSIYDSKNQTFHNEVHDPEKSNSLNQNSIYDIYEDKYGSVWLGTYYGGVNVYHPNASNFEKYKHYSYKNSLSSNVISAIVEDQQNNLWIGTEAEGLNYYNRKTQIFSSFKNQLNQNSLSSNLVKAISINKDGNLWIAAYESGVDFYNTKTKTFKNYKLNPIDEPNSMAYKRVTYLYIDKKDQLWVGTKGKGLFIYDSNTDSFKSITNGKSELSLNALNINYIFEDSHATLWVATDIGLYYLTKGQSKFKNFSKLVKGMFNNISCINQVGEHQIWFGSLNNGLAYYDSTIDKVITFSSKNNVIPNTIAGILEDNKGSVWISTDKGLLKYNHGNFKIYNQRDGLPGNVFNYHSYLKDSKGELFFGGYNGMVSFMPEDITANKTLPNVVFTQLRLFNKPVNVNDESGVLPQSLNSLPQLVLAHQQNIFSIDFAALNYVKSAKNKYAYKLEGVDKEWNIIKQPTASFSNLPSGKYTLLVKAANNDGLWNSNPTALRIIVKPPFWLTWWAFLFYALCLVAILYLINRYLLIRALIKKENEVHQSKLAFFTNVSHEIRTPLTLIIAPLEKLIKETQGNFVINRQLLTVNKNANRLMRLINELMDFRKVEAGKMKLNISPNNIVPFVNEIFLSFSYLAEQKSINYSFTTNNEIIEVYFDREQLEKIIFNLLSNAFKFVSEDNGSIEVQIEANQKEVFISIIDNGIGISNENKANLFTDFYQVESHQKRNTGTGIGLAFSKSLAKLHHGDLILEDSSTNTHFKLSLPLGSSHFNQLEIKNTLDFDDSQHYRLQSEVDLLNDEEVKKPNSVSAIEPLLLVVEDNVEIRNFIVKSLNKTYQVIWAEDGAEGLEIALQKIPDIIISDVMMPILDGYQFCNKIKSAISTRHIPVILLTARSGDMHEVDGLKNGADIYLSKPFSLQKLKLIVDNLLALQQNMRERFSNQFTLQPSIVEIESSDEEFLNKVLTLLEDNISNSEFNVNLFASEIGMSTPVFYKKIKALTGLTVNNFIKSIRLKRAAQLLNQDAGNVSEIAYMVGFNDAKYFSKEFRKQFGQSPSAYIDEQ